MEYTVKLDFKDWLWGLFCSSSSSDDNSEDESMSEGEMARLKEEVEEKKKLITTLRNKPWRMKEETQVPEVKRISFSLFVLWSYWLSCPSPLPHTELFLFSMSFMFVYVLH